MRTFDAIESIPQGQYGPTLKPGSGASFPQALGEMDEDILNTVKRVGEFVGSRDVGQLEALSTAVWIRVREEPRDDVEVTQRLQTLKPHIQEAEAEVAARDSKAFLEVVR